MVTTRFQNDPRFGGAFSSSALAPPTPSQGKGLFVQKPPPRSDAMANALMASAYAEAPKSPFDALGKLAMLYSGNKQRDYYLKSQEDKAQAEKDLEYSQWAKFAGGAFPGDQGVKQGIDSGNLGILTAIATKAMEGPDKPDYGYTAVDGTLVRTNPETGDAVPVYGQLQSGQPAPLFKGISVEAQALNGLVAAGKLTPEQAMQLGAGKTITTPQGQIMFMTPEGVFAKIKKNGNGQNPQTNPTQDGAAEQPIVAPDGTEEVPLEYPGMIPLTDKKTEGTDAQMTSGLYADRMKASHEIITRLEDAGTGFIDVNLADTPLIGNYLTSDKFKNFDQARRDFINAVLRRESGAVISDTEFDTANKQYLPQPGDPPALLEQKRQNREISIAGIQRAAGPNYTPLTLDTARPPPPGVDQAVWDDMTPEEQAKWP